MQRIEDEEQEKLEAFQKGAEQIWRQLTKVDFAFDRKAAHWIGNWKDETGESTLKVTRSGEFIQFEQMAGTKVRSGLAAIKSGSIVLISINESETNPRPSLGLLSFDGPFSAGHLIVDQNGTRLRALHINGNKLVSVKEYNRVQEDASGSNSVPS